MSSLRKLLQGLLSSLAISGGKAFAANESTAQNDGFVGTFGEGVCWNEISKETGEGWVQIAPYGEFPNDVGLQVFTRKEADAVVKAYNEGPRRSMAEKLLGLPIFVGHPDVPEMSKEYPDKKIYGYIKGLEA